MVFADFSAVGRRVHGHRRSAGAIYADGFDARWRISGAESARRPLSERLECDRYHHTCRRLFVPLLDQRASGNNPVLNITMNTNKSIEAVFGTTLSKILSQGTAGILFIRLSPLYPYGRGGPSFRAATSRKLFGVWGNAASGNTNPLFYTMRMPARSSPPRLLPH